MNNKLIFSAINPYIQDNIVKPTESLIRGQEYVSWGDNNQYPMYLNGLYESVPSLQTLINGNTRNSIGLSVKIAVFFMQCYQL